ncbi:MAG: GNAT family N-acetyltransferase [Acidimicrobiia bacterium]|nr:GNAT family N-acetyltransferase [Acidimicrobiia bacterium]
MAIEVHLYDDPSVALARAGKFLASRPVHRNLVLTLLHGRIARPEPGRYWVAHDGDRGVGVGFQSPLDFFVTTTPMTDEATDALVARIAADGIAPPGVQAEAATAARFTGQWTEATGSAARPDQGLRIYQLIDLEPPVGVSGSLRVTTAADRAVVHEMIAAFHRDTGERSVLDPAVHDERIDAGVYSLWDDDGPRALVGRTETIAGMSRVQAVFTPPEWRRRGYAGAAVAAVSERIRAEGADAMLFTDLGNPTSNSVYRRIGYRAVAENLRYRFTG